MITDEQFEACRLAANESYKRHKGSIRGQIITPEDDWEWHFARELIALAQQIKPLEFVECSIQYRDLPAAYLKAETPLGNYTIHKYKYFGDQFATNYFYTGPGNGGKSFASESTAIEAANEDYQSRVLSCLVWGGV